MTKKRIFFISKDASWQKYRKDILEKLSAEFNCEVEILTIGPLRDYLKKSAIQYRIFLSFFPSSWKVSFFPGALLYLVKNKPDVVICLNNLSQFTEYAALFLCRIFHIHFVWWTHGYPFNQSADFNTLERIKQQIRLFFLDWADSIITFSPRGSTYLQKKGIKGEKIFTANNTLDTEKLKKIKKNILEKYTRRDLCKQLGISESYFPILFIGRILRKKRLENAIDAVSLLKKRYRNIFFVIIGGGRDLNWYKKYRKEEVQGYVRFLGEIYDEETIAKWCLISKVFLHPGGIGLSIVHALFFGLPVITEESSGSFAHGPEIFYLKDGENGYMIPANDIQMIAKKLEFLICNENARQAMSNNAEKTILEYGDVLKTVKYMAQALKII